MASPEGGQLHLEYRDAQRRQFNPPRHIGIEDAFPALGSAVNATQPQIPSTVCGGQIEKVRKRGGKHTRLGAGVAQRESTGSLIKGGKSVDLAVSRIASHRSEKRRVGKEW